MSVVRILLKEYIKVFENVDDHGCDTEKLLDFGSAKMVKFCHFKVIVFNTYHCKYNRAVTTFM